MGYIGYSAMSRGSSLFAPSISGYFIALNGLEGKSLTKSALKERKKP
jgi:hypothetical protein